MVVWCVILWLYGGLYCGCMVGCIVVVWWVVLWLYCGLYCGYMVGCIVVVWWVVLWLYGGFYCGCMGQSMGGYTNTFVSVCNNARLSMVSFLSHYIRACLYDVGAVSYYFFLMHIPSKVFSQFPWKALNQATYHLISHLTAVLGKRISSLFIIHRQHRRLNVIPAFSGYELHITKCEGIYYNFTFSFNSNNINCNILHLSEIKTF